MTRTRSTLLAAAVLTVLLAGCGDSNDKSNADAQSNADTFVLNEWAITPPTARLEAGKIRITATNIGSETHELVIVRAPTAASLPTKADGSVDEDKIPEADKPGEIGDVGRGKTVTKTLDLPAGHYVAICNLVDQMGTGSSGMTDGTMGGSGMSGNAGMGHVHFRLGMKARFTVH